MARFVYEVRHLGLDKKTGAALQYWRGEATAINMVQGEDGEPSLYMVFDGSVPVFSIAFNLFESARVLEHLTHCEEPTEIGAARAKPKPSKKKAPLASPRPL